MSIFGTHTLLYSSKPEELRAMLRDVFGFQWVDAHGGWLIFALPPAELGIHPGEGSNYESGIRHEIAFMCDDIHKTVAELRTKGVNIPGEPETQSYGITINMKLPGDVNVTLYEPRHKMAISPACARAIETTRSAAPASHRFAPPAPPAQPRQSPLQRAARLPSRRSQWRPASAHPRSTQ